MRAIITRNVERNLICTLLLLLWAVPTLAQSTNDGLGGYIVYPTEEGIELYRMDSGGTLSDTPYIVDQFTIEGHYATDWNIIRRDSMIISPDQSALAFVAVDNTNDVALFLLNLQTLVLEQYDLLDVVSFTPLWSPDSTAILLQSGAVTGVTTVIFELATANMIYLNLNHITGPRWLSDSKAFVFVGPNVCSSQTCKADNDLYAGNRETGNVQPLTNLDMSTLETIEEPRVPVSFGAFTWSETANRIYGELSDLEDELELLYSVDLGGNFILENDLTHFYPESHQKPEIRFLFSKPASPEIYIALENDFRSGLAYRWTILRFNVQNKTTEVVIEKDFFTYQTEQTILSSAFSPDGRYIALGGSGEANGSILVIDINNVQFVLDIQIPYPPCNLEWISSETIVYSQHSQSSWIDCLSFRTNQPFEQLISHNIANNTTRIIFESSNNVAYFVPLHR